MRDDNIIPVNSCQAVISLTEPEEIQDIVAGLRRMARTADAIYHGREPLDHLPIITVLADVHAAKIQRPLSLRRLALYILRRIGRHLRQRRDRIRMVLANEVAKRG